MRNFEVNYDTVPYSISKISLNTLRHIQFWFEQLVLLSHVYGDMISCSTYVFIVSQQETPEKSRKFYSCSRWFVDFFSRAYVFSVRLYFGILIQLFIYIPDDCHGYVPKLSSILMITIFISVLNVIYQYSKKLWFICISFIYLIFIYSVMVRDYSW